MTCSFFLSVIKPSHFRFERMPKVWVNNSELTIHGLVASGADGKILKYKNLAAINYFFQSKVKVRIRQSPLQHKLNVKLKKHKNLVFFALGFGEINWFK